MRVVFSFFFFSSNWFFTCFVKGFDVVPNEERKKAERKWGRREKKRVGERGRTTLDLPRMSGRTRKEEGASQALE
jgi:hypothetical protein